MPDNYYRDEDGYRYIHSYRIRSGEWRYALWERVNGKMRRVGTAHTDEEYRTWLLRLNEADNG